MITRFKLLSLYLEFLLIILIEARSFLLWDLQLDLNPERSSDQIIITNVSAAKTRESNSTVVTLYIKGGGSGSSSDLTARLLSYLNSNLIPGYNVTSVYTNATTSATSTKPITSTTSTNFGDFGINSNLGD